MNSFHKFITISALLVVLVSQAKAQPFWDGTTANNWTGSGAENDPYLITTPQQLAGIAAAVRAGNDFNGKFIKLANDLYLSNPADEHENKPQWTPIGIYVMTWIGESYTLETFFFKGTFDGGGHKIFGAYYSNVPNLDDWNDPFGNWTIDFTGWYKGFFGHIQNAVIKNVNLVDVTMVGAADMGGLVCYNDGGSIINCTVTGKVGSMNDQVGGGAGGLVGTNKNGGIIENCHSEADVRGVRGTGGLVGTNEYCTIRNSHATGNVAGSQYYVGGFVGVNAGQIENCFANGDVLQGYYSYNQQLDLGGFVGTNAGTIARCYATGNVTTYNRGGSGFVGVSQDGVIIDCYATGNVTAGVAAGFAGQVYNTSGTTGVEIGGFYNCFYTGTVTPTGYLSGVKGFVCIGDYTTPFVNCYYNSETSPQVDRNEGSDFRTTAQMQSHAFVDTLNMIAAILGTSTWQYRAGQYPIPTGTPATNLNSYLAGGDGSETTPYLINTKKQLENFAIFVNKGYSFKDKNVKLGANIALNAPQTEWGISAPTPWIAIGGFAHIDYQTFQFRYPFRGTFDGNGYEISNLYMDNLKIEQGLFGYLGNGAVVKNLGVVDAWVKANDAVGILAGRGSNATVIQCWTSGKTEATGNYAGGLFGSEDRIIIKNSYSMSDIKASYAVSGLLNGGEWTTIENSFFAGTLSSGRQYAISPNGKFTNCFYDSQTTGINGGSSTEYLQGKEFVNELNYWVDAANDQGAEQYLYWQHTEGEYPKFTTSVPPHSITYNSNGGSHVPTQRALDASKILTPPDPIKVDFVFGGWYQDVACTTLFDFNTEIITSDRTLYAKWVQPFAPDISWFNNPFATTFVIYTKEQLAGFALLVNGKTGEITPNDFAGKTVKLGADILLNDISDWEHWGTLAFANKWTPIGSASSNPFKGTFDGDGHKVSGIYINLKDMGTYSWYQGLFGHIGSGAEIKNLGIDASFIKGGSYVGGLAGNFNGAAITNCYSDAKVIAAYGDYAGGLAGCNNGGAITNCNTRGSVKGYNYTGGLIGDHIGGAITNCYSTANVSGTGSIGGLAGRIYNAATSVTNSYATGNVSGSDRVGGLIGNNSGAITNCNATGNVSGGSAGGLVGYNNGAVAYCNATGNVTGENGAGGLVGTNTSASAAVISNSYATGDVNGTTYTGGLAGVNSNSITNCYATGNVTGSSYVGGLAGSNGNTIINCFSIGSVTGASNVGGLSGNVRPVTNSYYNRETTGLNDTNKGTPKTTSEMKQKVTFTGWDFTDIWGRNNAINNGYPYLRWSVAGYVTDDEDVSAAVTFVSNGGSNVPAQNVIIGLMAIAPSPPQREGYEFVNWYPVETLTGDAFNFSNTTITSDVALYAGWRVVYENNIGSALEIGNWTQNNVAWSSTGSGQLAFTAVGSSVVLPVFPEGKKQMNITIMAVYGSRINLETSPDGNVFTSQGAFTGTTTATSSSKTIPDGTRYVKLTATGASAVLRSAKVTWVVGNEEAYATVTFVSNGGSAVTPVAGAIIGMTIVAPVAPTKTDHIFNGWYSDESLTQAYNFDAKIAEATTLYAKWTEIAYAISASTPASFGSLPAPYTQPAAQTVTITNTGTGSVTLTQPSATNYDIGALSTLTLATNGETATFTVRPKAGLVIGTYNETITIRGSNNTSATVSVSFSVTAAPTYIISASTLTSFGSLQTPYTPPVAQTVTITNNGTGAVTLTQPAATNYDIGALSITTLASNGQTATFAVRPKAGLSAGTYNETIDISGNNGASATVEVSFSVTAENIVNAQTPVINVQPQNVTVNQNGGATLTVAAYVNDDGIISYQWYSNATNSANGGTAISGATGTSYTPPTATVGTMYYYAIVTNTNNSVNGVKTATTVSNVAAVTVTAQSVTGSEDPATANPLKAWMRNGLLHISGITAGEPLYIYTVTGALVYQTIATSGEVDIALEIQGMYIIQQGSHVIKLTMVN